MLNLLYGVLAGKHGGTGGGGAFPCPATPSRLTETGYGTLTTPPTTVTPGGGTAPYTYAWIKISGQAGITITTPTLASTTFSGAPGDGGTLTATFKCTVTDSAGKIGYSNTVIVLLTGGV